MFFNIQGTAVERGLIAWKKEMELNVVESFDIENDEEYKPNTFDFPIGMSLLRR